MSVDATGVSSPPHTPSRESDTWGASEIFQQLTDVSIDTADYWVDKVHRPAHRVSHPVPMAECPGCAFETAVAR